MSLYFAVLGSPGLTDVGYVWKDSAGADIGSRTEVGVSEIESGSYGADITPPGNAEGIFWNSAAEDTFAYAMGGVLPDIPTASETAAAVEAAILDEGDATALLAAIAAKVEEFVINDGDATATIAAIAAACNTAVEGGAVGTDATSILAAVAALNDVSTADLDTALATYDGPTLAEMLAAFTEIKGATFDGDNDTLEDIRDNVGAAPAAPYSF